MTVGLISRIKHFFQKGGAKLGMGKDLNSITDDPRIQTTSSEVERIQRGMNYYAGNYIYSTGMKANTIDYKNHDGETRHRQFNTINMTKMCASRLASICLNEQFEISLQGNDDLQAKINAILDDSDFKNVLEEKFEQGLPTGGFAARPYVDDSDQIRIAWVRSDQFYSLDANTQEVSQAAIASRTIKVVDGTRYYYTLLEFHQWDGDDYVITNELYRSENATRIGVQVPLGSDDVDTGIEANVRIPQLSRPLFVYFKNPGPNNKEPESPLGVGIVENNRSILDAINYIHDARFWEVRMGKKKVAVNGSLVKPGDELHAGPYFDPDDDTIMSVNARDAGTLLQDITPEIRADAFDSMMQQHLKELENGMGLSTGTFTKDADGGVQTATQVVSENSMTYQTRSSYLTKLTKFITELIESIVEVGSAEQLFTDGKAPFAGMNVDVDKLQVDVHYDDGVFVDKDSQQKNDMLAVQAGVLPKLQFIMRTYGLSMDDAQTWLDQIQSEAPSSPFGESKIESDLNNEGDG
ncbi:capsid protein [Furfurilactobacillus rossiae]|nr:capsid protein [Furfurilactobacillus rossiae]